MNAKQAIMGQLLQTSLFKLADEVQHTLEKLYFRHPEAITQIKEFELEVERNIDSALQAFQDDHQSFSMQDIDKIHGVIIRVRGLLE